MDVELKAKLYRDAIFEAWEDLYGAAVHVESRLKYGLVVDKEQVVRLTQAIERRPSVRLNEKLIKGE